MVCLKSTNSEPTHAQLVVMCVDLHVLVCDHSHAIHLNPFKVLRTQATHTHKRAHTHKHTHTIGHPQMTGVALAELMQRARPVLVVAAAEVLCQSFVMPVKCLRIAVFIRVCISRSSKTK